MADAQGVAVLDGLKDLLEVAAGLVLRETSLFFTHFVEQVASIYQLKYNEDLGVVGKHFDQLDDMRVVYQLQKHHVGELSFGAKRT